MRLIDADELMAKVNSVRYLRKRKAQSLCNACEKIEAIPLKWLEYLFDIYHETGNDSMADAVADIVQKWLLEETE